MPNLELMKFMMPQAILQIFIYLRNLLRYFLSLTHVEVEYLFLLLCVPNLMHQLILEHLIGDHGRIEIPLDILGHLESFLCQLPKLLLKVIHTVIHERIVLAESIHYAVQLFIVCLEVLLPAFYCPLETVQLVFDRC